MKLHYAYTEDSWQVKSFSIYRHIRLLRFNSYHIVSPTSPFNCVKKPHFYKGLKALRFDIAPPIKQQREKDLKAYISKNWNKVFSSCCCFLYVLTSGVFRERRTNSHEDIITINMFQMLIDSQLTFYLFPYSNFHSDRSKDLLT